MLKELFKIVLVVGILILVCGFLGVAFINCNSNSNITSPTATITPTPTPKPQFDSLKVTGNQFNYKLKGAVICCYDPYTLPNSWPLISAEALHQIAAAGGNYTHIRPSDSGSIDASTLGLDSILNLAETLNIVVEVDVIDAWVLRNNVSLWPGDTCDVTASPPAGRHLDWIKSLVQATGKYPNVIYQVGNETYLCKQLTLGWEVGVKDAIIQDLLIFDYSPHLIGSNSQTLSWHEFFDYVTYHLDNSVISGDRPTIINEQATDSMDVNKWIEIYQTEPEGVYWQLWWTSNMNTTDWLEGLSQL